MDNFCLMTSYQTFFIFAECECPKSKTPSKIPDSYCDEHGFCECYKLNGDTFEFRVSKGQCVKINDNRKSY